jgi:hypothetical protein
MKICSKCGINKEETEFVFRNKLKNKRVAYCRTCSREILKKHYKDNKKYYVDKARRNDQFRVLALRMHIFKHLKNNACIDCGESDIVVLEFDHVRDKKSSDISALLHKKCSIEVLKKEIAKCDVRCANCHKRKTAKLLKSWRTYFQAPVD